MSEEQTDALDIDPTDATDVTFASLGVPAPLVAVLEDGGITAPFPVQAATLPDALAGRDILGRAQTGSGKTLGFSLPLVSRLAGGQTASRRPRGLILVPTRELATQVHTVLRPLARAMGLWVTTIYGGVSYGPQVTALHRKTDIVVATPGRLADLIGQGECDLSDVEITVIDEADQMADLGFLPMIDWYLDGVQVPGASLTQSFHASTIGNHTVRVRASGAGFFSLVNEGTFTVKGAPPRANGGLPSGFLFLAIVVALIAKTGADAWSLHR